MFTLKELLDWSVTTNIRPGVWVPARPIVSPWRRRISDALAVLNGTADAFTWPEGQ